MRRFSFCRLALCALPLALSACDSVDDWLNRNMPVIGSEHCEHWQCVTGSGQEQSEYNRQERLRREAAEGSGRMSPVENPIAAPAPTAAPPPAATPQQPLAPAVPGAPTYTYVPRKPLPPGASPFEGNVPPAE